MWPFEKKKKKPNPEYVPPATTKSVCCHKYKDFSWYAEATYNRNTQELVASIYEPYVCIHCGHRKDVELDSVSRWPIDYETAQEVYDKFQEPYLDKLRKKAFVEDEIHDMLLVDRSYIEIYMRLHEERFKKNEESKISLSLPG